MQKTFFIIFLCAFMNNAHAQRTVLSTEQPTGITPPTEMPGTETDNKIYKQVDVQASYPGGDIAWKKYIQSAINKAKLKDSIPLPEGKTNFSQTVTVTFIVAKDGGLSDFRCVSKDADKNIAAEAVRVAKRSIRWVPAQVNGKPVNSYCSQQMDISF